MRGRLAATRPSALIRPVGRLEAIRFRNAGAFIPCTGRQQVILYWQFAPQRVVMGGAVGDVSGRLPWPGAGRRSGAMPAAG